MLRAGIEVGQVLLEAAFHDADAAQQSPTGMDRVAELLPHVGQHFCFQQIGHFPAITRQANQNAFSFFQHDAG